MFEIYRVNGKTVKQKLNLLIERKIGEGFEIKTTRNGKPYIEGNPIYFSVTHSQGFAFIVLCDRPVGVDYEVIRERKFSAVLSRFTPREIEDISGATEKFLKNWVAKEAYVKMIGGTLAHDLKRLEFYDKKLYFNGVEKDVSFEWVLDGILAYCTEENK